VLPDGGVRCSMLEPYEANVSSTVLRGRESREALLLPDRNGGRLQITTRITEVVALHGDRLRSLVGRRID
jgi:hypothetical protein